MVKHDFLNLKSCNDDKEGLTKTLREGKETSVRQPGPNRRRMHVVERGTGDNVLVCIVFTDRHQTYCKRKTGFHCLRIQNNLVKSRNKTVKQVAWNT